ncbi:MAG: hypothetical protein WCF39_09960, partial [Pseudolabrys sp.]
LRAGARWKQKGLFGGVSPDFTLVQINMATLKCFSTTPPDYYRMLCCEKLVNARFEQKQNTSAHWIAPFAIARHPREVGDKPAD